MSSQRQDNKDTGRMGASTLEFASLLPLFVIFAVLIVESQEMMLRAMCNSHAAFAGARRWLVAGVDVGYVQKHYEGSGMRGSFAVTPDRAGSKPQSMTVKILDSYNILSPTGSSEGVFPGLKQEQVSRFSVTESVSGGGRKATNTDNDI